jgi:hypothetical protein
MLHMTRNVRMQVEYNSGQYYEEDEQLLWNHYSGIFHTSPTEPQRIYFQERAPGQTPHVHHARAPRTRNTHTRTTQSDIFESTRKQGK